MKGILEFGHVTAEFEAASQAKFFDKIAQLAAIAPEPCGHCGCEKVTFQKRVHSQHVFRTYKCTKCGAELNLFENQQTGDLWKVRQNKDKTPKGERGWAIYTPGERQSNAGSAYSAPDNDPPPQSDPSDTPF